MKRLLPVMILLCLFGIQALAQNQTVNNGEATTPIFFGGVGCYYNWTNSNPTIGLPASGRGNLPSFIAKNLGTGVESAVITATPAISYDTVYMASQSNPRVTVTVTDSQGGRVYGLQTGAAPFGIAIGLGNSRAYITNQGSGTVSVFQILFGVPMSITTIPVGADPLTSAPEGIAASPDGKWIYVANSADNSLSVIKTANLSPAGTIPLNGVDHPSGIVASPDGQWLYVTNYGSTSVTRVKVTPGVDSVSGTIAGIIPVQRNPEGIAISPDGNTLYVANYGSNSVSIHNISANITTTIPVGTKPFGIALSRGGTTLYVANSGSDDVTVIDATNNTFKKTVKLAVGSSPRGIATTSDDTKIYIADYGDAFMSVIDASNFAVSQLPTLDIGNVALGNFVNGGSGCTRSPATFNITVNPTPPTLKVTGPIAPLHTSFGIPSPSGSFTVSGVTLSEPITITAPTGFELSIDNVTFSSSLTLGGPGNVNSTTVYVRLTARTPENTYNGVIRLHSSPAADATIAVSGDVEAAKPYITVGPVTGSITGCAGSPSVAPHIQQFNVSASDLRGVLSAYTTSPNFQVSLDPNTGYASNITLGNGGNVSKTVYVRSVAASPGYMTATVNVFSPGADRQPSVTVNSIISPEPVADPVSSQTVADNTATAPVTFTGRGSNTFTWTNDHPEIGLPANGRGDIDPFTAVNTTNKPIVATITATPVATGLAYVTNLSQNTLSVVDLMTRTIIPPVIPTGASPRFLLVGPDGTKIYVANFAERSVSVIDAGNHHLIKNILVSQEPIGLALTPDGKTLQVFNLLSGLVTLIDVINDVAIGTIPWRGHIPGTPFSPDGKWAYPYSFDGQSTAAVDNTGSRIPSVVIGDTTTFGATVVSPDGTRVYTTNRGIVKVYNEADNTLITTIDLAGHTEGNNINGLALSPDGNILYATYGNDDQIFVVDTQGFEIITTLDGGRLPYAIAISPGTGCSGTPVQFTITVEPTPPTIVVTGTADPLTTPQGIPSPYTHVNVSGLRLTDDIHIDAPGGFELSLDGLTFSSSVSISMGTNNGTVPPTPLYIRLTGASQGNYTDNIRLHSTGAQDVYIPVSGTVSQPRPTLYATEASGTIMACMGEVSESPFLQLLQVHAVLLTQGVTVTAPQGFEVSLGRDPGSFAAHMVIPGNPDGSLGITTVYVRAAVAGVAGPISGAITISSPGAVDLPVQVEGTINPLPGVQQVNKVTVAGGNPVSVSFTALNGANAFTWTNDKPEIGLSATGAANISFTAVNNTSEPITARITVTPKSAATAYIAANNARVVVLNTGSDKEESPILSDNTRSTPYAVAISPDGKWVYIADQASINRQNGQISVINTGTNQVVQTVYAGNRPSGLVVSPDGKTLYVTNSGSYDMSVIDLQGPAPVKIADIPVGNDPEGIAITPDGKWLYMTNRTTTTNVVVLNTADLHQALVPIALGLRSPKSIAVLPDGSKVYVTDENSNNIGVINNETKTPMTAIAAGGASSGIAVSPDGEYIYVSSTGLGGAGTVKVIRTSDNSLVRSITVGRNPKGLSLTPDGTRIYVACTGSTVSNGTVYTIDNQHLDAGSTEIKISGPPASYGTFITGGTGCDGAPMTFDIEVTPAASSVGVSGTLAALTTTYGTPSPSISFTVRGNTISSPIDVVPPAGFELSMDNSLFKPSLSIGATNTTIPNTPVYVRLSGTTPVGEYNGNITLGIGNGSPANVPTVLSTVLPAPLTIRADDKSRLHGVDNPPLTATYTGFVNNESPQVLTSPVLLTTSATTDSPIGQYPITAANAAAINYAITYTAGVLTILDAPPALSVPNTFTPNGDGINDVWVIKNMDRYPGIVVSVFNRNGQRVFFSVNYPSPWNGRYNGSDLPAGTYYYIITPGKGFKPLTGYLAIIR